MSTWTQNDLHVLYDIVLKDLPICLIAKTVLFIIYSFTSVISCGELILKSILQSNMVSLQLYNLLIKTSSTVAVTLLIIPILPRMQMKSVSKSSHIDFFTIISVESAISDFDIFQSNSSVFNLI